MDYFIYNINKRKSSFGNRKKISFLSTSTNIFHYHSFNEWLLSLLRMIIKILSSWFLHCPLVVILQLTIIAKNPLLKIKLVFLWKMQLPSFFFLLLFFMFFLYKKTIFYVFSVFTPLHRNIILADFHWSMSMKFTVNIFFVWLSLSLIGVNSLVSCWSLKKMR